MLGRQTYEVGEIGDCEQTYKIGKMMLGRQTY